MTKKLQHLFALSKKGAEDLVKAVIWCFVCNLSLMLPVGAVLFTEMCIRDSLFDCLGWASKKEFQQLSLISGKYRRSVVDVQGVCPVSYTHLDVYKRQPLRSSKRLCPGAKCPEQKKTFPIVHTRLLSLLSSLTSR